MFILFGLIFAFVSGGLGCWTWHIRRDLLGNTTTYSPPPSPPLPPPPPPPRRDNPEDPRNGSPQPRPERGETIPLLEMPAPILNQPHNSPVPHGNQQSEYL